MTWRPPKSLNFSILYAESFFLAESSLKAALFGWIKIFYFNINDGDICDAKIFVFWKLFFVLKISPSLVFKWSIFMCSEAVSTQELSGKKKNRFCIQNWWSYSSKTRGHREVIPLRIWAGLASTLKTKTSKLVPGRILCANVCNQNQQASPELNFCVRMCVC